MMLVFFILEGNQTADEVAESLGIPVTKLDLPGLESAVIHGNELINMEEAQLDEIIRCVSEQKS